VEDVTETYPLKNQPLLSSSLKNNPRNTPQTTSEAEILEDDTENQEKVTKSVVEKETTTSHNT